MLDHQSQGRTHPMARDRLKNSRENGGNSIVKTTALAGLLAAILASPALALDKVSVQLDYVVRGDHAMFFVAKQKGYFANEGLDVTDIRRGTGSPNAMRLVGNGDADFGFGALPTLAVARSQDVPVVALVAVN